MTGAELESQEFRNEFRIGDVILIGGNVFWLRTSSALAGQSRGFGHVGIVTALSPSILVLEASGSPLSDGEVAETTLSHFLRDAEWYAVLRSEFGGELAINAQEAASIAHGFDDDFDLNNADRLYCTELLDEAMKKLETPSSLERRVYFGREVILPSDIIHHPMFHVVARYPMGE